MQGDVRHAIALLAYEQAPSGGEKRPPDAWVESIRAAYPNRGPAEVLEDCSLGWVLAQEATGLGFEVNRNERDSANALVILGTRCPGFSEQTYRDVLANALHDTAF